MRKAILIICLLTLLPFGCNCHSPDLPKARTPLPQINEQRETIFLYIKIPEPIMPDVRESKYEDPIDELLKRANLGEVTGGGTMLNKDKTIDYVGIDVDVYDPAKAIPLLISKLKELKAPNGTLIEQEKPIKQSIDIYK